MLRYDYNPVTGKFIHKISRGGAKKGSTAGTLLTATGYLRVMIFGKSYALHKLAFLYMTGELPPDEVDHINRIKTDNRFSNLRLSDKRGNCGNTGLRKHNTTGYKGVFKIKNGWMVRCAGKYIGCSDDIEIAAMLYDIAAELHYGEFSLTNRKLGILTN